ncbi:MAG: hypothetical protein LBD23_16725 [Oscillospiraceae bacterium]|jgi:hypothetical protein|nr:hypothetical protein [Oscillospiraceae bacterium]
MSIRGIDTQIMITRATDFVRETSSIQRQPEISQEHLAQQTKIESTQDQSRVIATMESDMENIRADEDGEGSGAADGGKKRQEEQEPEGEEVVPELRIAPAPHDHIIDMMI